jgi:hypothetical protein
LEAPVTAFRRKVLESVSYHEYTGPMEITLDITGCDHIDVLNVDRAIAWLVSEGYMETHYFTVTDKGKAALGAT